MDAQNLMLPPCPLVLLMFNPFKANIMRRVLNVIWQSYEADPRDIMMVYIHPVCEKTFSEFPVFVKIIEDRQFFIYRSKPPAD